MDYHIAVVPGDGIGPEVITETIKVLDQVGKKFAHHFQYTEVLAGGAAIDAVFYAEFSAATLIGGCLAFAGLVLNALGARKKA